MAFADDIVLIANNEEELQELVSIASNHARAWRFTFNTKKCKVMVFNSKSKISNISLEDDSLKLANAYKYLGMV